MLIEVAQPHTTYREKYAISIDGSEIATGGLRTNLKEGFNFIDLADSSDSCLFRIVELTLAKFRLEFSNGVSYVWSRRSLWKTRWKIIYSLENEKSTYTHYEHRKRRHSFHLGHR